ncbi:hypothetical protein [Halostagnicola sp. A-GB9-2]|uniref:hypothetical protein n=1 Tax=Halostagnicola sp. A-GB9-2 TaxID=3048066 RepID=UPI0024BFC67C|nr:hypothetical protein [Halostagnicola sp. A-GB9-2]MDJ1433159.1 hypothetical protein [Halostagnicola sp. A-GB9-2]
MTPNTSDHASVRTTAPENRSRVRSENHGRPRRRTSGRASSPGPNTGSKSRQEGQSEYSCPVCAFDDETRTDVYEHLLSSHRKSTITSALLRQHVDPES